MKPRCEDSLRPPNGGEGALLAGVLALLFVVVPVVGDVVAVPVALVAVVLGLRGFLREEGSSWRCVVGAAAGLFSLFAVLLMVAATGLP